MRAKFRLIFLSLLFFLPLKASERPVWGFYAHQLINRMAIFSLPPELFPFYKQHVEFISKHAVDPDRRRHAVPEEAPRHYIDIDYFGDSAVYTMPRYWLQAVEQYPADTLKAYGIVPWQIMWTYRELVEAFKVQNLEAILRLSADLGHYIADANVPLHTTLNYNGQLTGQEGVHALWESRLPELFAEDYDFLVGRATYLERPQLTAWAMVRQAHEAVDSVLLMEKQVTEALSDADKYAFEERNGKSIRTYSRPFSEAYHKALDGQVERQLQRSILYVASFWYSAWVDAGQPAMQSLTDAELSEATLEKLAAEKLKWEAVRDSLPEDQKKEKRKNEHKKP